VRQVIVKVPRGHGRQVLEIARAHQGANLACFAADGPESSVDLVLLHVPNQRIDPLIEELEELPDLALTLLPIGIIPLRPPATEAPDQVTDVGHRSPIEIFLAGLQSVGSWKGFLGYATAAGFVVWIGLFTSTIYLLIAAMLIAPFAGPAMNAAIATARGDWYLLGRSLLRYVVALVVTIAVAAMLTLVLRQEIATPLMVETSQVSMVAVLLPLVAGAAGALNLSQSQSSSLVSGAAVGMLVAASLAPPAGIVGMAMAMGKWEMVRSGMFVLLLQFVGINLSGTLIFRAFGLSSQGVRYDRGQSWIVTSGLLVTSLALGALLAWQFWTTPDLQHSSRSQRAAAEIQQALNASDLVGVVEINARFTRGDIPGQNTLLATVFVQRLDGVDTPAEQIREELTRTLQERLLQAGFNVTPLVDVTVLDPP
jgi:uncharacterized hydrophobic protein (TIGR00271 family)